MLGQHISRGVRIPPGSELKKKKREEVPPYLTATSYIHTENNTDADFPVPEKNSDSSPKNFLTVDGMNSEYSF